MAQDTGNIFIDSQPSRDSYWRGIVLFGRNVASYKLALAKSLLSFAEQGCEVVTLDELSGPFSEQVCEHLKQADRQGTSSRSRFLDACRSFNGGELERSQLVEVTARLGFQNVIEAFHNVGAGALPVRFFEDERNTKARGIRITDDLHHLVRDLSPADLEQEAESRWRLVETAWELGLPRDLLTVTYEPDGELLLPANRTRTRAITPVRGALNGYQKGCCFYCFTPIGITTGTPQLAQVDHFFPHVLKRSSRGGSVNFDGVWNLALACRDCNGSKSASLPANRYLERLHRRNEYLIGSHHPLRETLMAQTGASEDERIHFLQYLLNEVTESGLGVVQWETEARDPAAF